MTMSNNGYKIGALGEEAAAVWLEKKGCRILERNFRTRHGEIDIIAADGDCLVFVEVKTRKNADYGYPSDFVNKKKQERLKYAATMYCRDDICMRFDVIEVFYRIKDNKFTVTEINHIEGAF